ncbi:conserved hypothetical protein [Chloroflexus aggregans DSM 9485]|uniref:Glycosyltransferase RgtA/B/C/D-like domain-containing protein n=2 Tax=Chloroflexus aggregans TaxID=152260 RepID=B8G5N4_CHLAD|nr:conserved hypothetical protein [Chloroflexus aggregans DSM 9485]
MLTHQKAIPMRRLWLIIGLLFCCYAYILPRWSDWNQNSRLNLVLALVDDGTPRIDRYVANTGDYALYRGHTYSDKPPGLSFLGIPIYAAIRPLLDAPPVQAQFERLGSRFADTFRADGSGLQTDKVRFALVQYLLTLVVVALPAALCGGLFFWVLQRMGIDSVPASIGALGYGLATSAAPYAGNFYAHQLVAVLLFTAFVLAWLPSEQLPLTSVPQQPPPDHVTRSGQPALQRDMIRGVIVGLLLGWAVISEYPAAPAAAIIGFYALYRRGRRWLPAMMLGGILPIGLLIGYDLAAFGTPWSIGYAYSALWQEQHHTGFMSLTMPQWEAIWGLTFSEFRGLFFRAPWLLLALPAYWIGWRWRDRRAEWLVLLLVPLAFLLFYGSSIMWWGGFAAGPRYIVPLIPFLALPASLLIGYGWHLIGLRVSALGLIGISFVLVWMEATAGQLFPSDAVRATWREYVIPAWQQGDIARNAGMVFNLSGPISLLPLLGMVITAVIVLWRPLEQATPTPVPSIPTTQPPVSPPAQR